MRAERARAEQSDGTLGLAVGAQFAEVALRFPRQNQHAPGGSLLAGRGLPNCLAHERFDDAQALAEHAPDCDGFVREAACGGQIAAQEPQFGSAQQRGGQILLVRPVTSGRPCAALRSVEAARSNSASASSSRPSASITRASTMSASGTAEASPGPVSSLRIAATALRAASRSPTAIERPARARSTSKRPRWARRKA